MRGWKSFWSDEGGSVVSAEMVMLGTVGVVGAGVGIDMARTAVNDEMRDVAFAIRSLDQSYEVQGYSTCKAAVAGSSFRQRPVAESIEELRIIERRDLPKDAGPLSPPADPGPNPTLEPKKQVEGVDPSATPEKKPAPKKDGEDGAAEGPTLRFVPRSVDA